MSSICHPEHGNAQSARRGIQVDAYAARKGMTPQQVERWLAPNLGYEPEDASGRSAAMQDSVGV